MFQEMLQQQYEIERKMKQDVLEREYRARVDLLESQKIAEDMRVLTMDTSSLDPMNAAIVLLPRHGDRDSGPDLSFDIPASPECMSGLARAISVEVIRYVSPLEFRDYRIPLDLHPRLPDSNLTMDRLPHNAIGSHFTVSPLRHSHSCVSDDLPLDGYDQNDAERLCAHLIRLREMKEAVLVRYGLSSVWSNRKSDLVLRRTSDNFEMGVYDFMTLPSWGDAKGTLVPLPTPDEIVVAQPNPKLAKKSKTLVKRKASTSSLIPLGPDQPTKKKRLRKKASEAGSSAPDLEQTEDVEDTDILEFCVEIEDSMERDEYPLDTLARSALARDEEYDQIPEDEFATASRGEEIDLTFFPLAPGPYVMPYPFEGDSSHEYNQQQWDGPHAPEDNILCKEIFKDPDVCKKDLDRTIKQLILIDD
ncbi:hypothetical protein Tco_1312131 [Tanacetum coccineum]